MNKKTIKDVDVSGKRVLVRVDFNVPLNDQGQITDTTRIKATLPTIEYLIDHHAKVILISHLGQPHGKFDAKLSLRPICDCISQLLGQKVLFADSVLGEKTTAMVENLQEGQILLLENLRFHLEEEENDVAFAQKLASYADLFVNDAFGTCHRAHASTSGVSKYLPSVGGFLIDRELEVMGQALQQPEREFTAIIGGAKVSSKIGVINNLLDRIDNLLIGGGMAFTFLKAQGHEIGKSLLDEEHIDYSRELMNKAEKIGVKIYIPVDVVAAEGFYNDAKSKIVPVDRIPADYMGLDIGPKTCDLFEKVILSSKTVIWNGPMGAFEMPNFANGTKRVALAMAQCQGVTIIGGGDSAAAIDQFGIAARLTHISTGGGASLELLEGKKLPGVEALMTK